MAANNASSSSSLDVSVTKNISQRVQKTTNSSDKRRCSPRLMDTKRPYYGPTPLPTTKPIQISDSLPLPLDVSSHTTDDDLVPSTSTAIVTLYAPHSRIDKTCVKQTIRLYNKHYLYFVQEFDAERQNDAKNHYSKKKNKTGEKRQVNRPDLKATSKMIELKQILFPVKRIGHLPGIDIGYQFFSRSEMVAIGLHSHWLSGIDYMGEAYSKMEELKHYTFPIAITIVLSGQYEDDQDNSDDIVYTGQGGNDLYGGKRQIKDQEMKTGNLALKNSKEQSIPVRVIRKRIDDHHTIIYTYDGLYEVSDCWPAEGVSGYIVYKYRLKRLKGQPKLTGNQVQYSNGRSSRVPVKAPKLVCLDITEGQEELYIPVTNTIDDATISGFMYSKCNQVLSNIKLPPNAGGCQCKGNCTNPKTCACARLNGSDFPYVQSDGGRLIEAKDIVFECGPNCGCGPGCVNRISQRGIIYHLEIFRTSDRGWAVKTRDFIPSGAPVCEYMGEIRRTSDLNNVDGNEYIFEIDCWQTMNEIGGRERRLGDVSESVSSKIEKAGDMGEAEPEFCIDAGRLGNVARFINHSCEPNLFVQCVLSSHHDVKLARIVLFACDNIPPMQEVTYDYGYALDSVVDKDGKVKTLACHCGTSECRKRLY